MQRIKSWDTINRFEKVILSKKIGNEIQDCHQEIEHCLQELNVRTHISLEVWALTAS